MPCRLRALPLLVGATAADGPFRFQKGPQAIYAPGPDMQEYTPGPGPNKLARTPPMGWMSWQVFRCEVDCQSHPSACINEDLYRQAADHLAADGFLEVGYNQASIDDCWEKKDGRDSNGKLVPDPARFPSGIKALADHMHSKGVRFGIYSDEGSKTCGGYPGTLGHEKDDAETFASWGVDYLKQDGCYASAPDYSSGYPALGAALQATGREIVYSCSWPAYLGDDESKKPFGAMIKAGCNLWRNWDDVQPSWSSLSSIIDHWGDYGSAMAPYAGPGHWHDMDMLLIGAGCLTHDEEKTNMAIWAISASPLIMGNDVRNISADSRAILLNKEAIAVSQDPLGRMGIRLAGLNSSSLAQVWSRPLANGDVAVALYNKDGNATRDITVDFASVGMDKRTSVFCIWGKKTLGIFEDNYTASAVPAHGTAFVRLSAQPRETALVI